MFDKSFHFGFNDLTHSRKLSFCDQACYADVHVIAALLEIFLTVTGTVRRAHLLIPLTG